ANGRGEARRDAGASSGGAALMQAKTPRRGSGLAEMAGAIPHFYGHRQRLRQRLIAGGPDNLPDYELLEVLLFAGNPRGDVKPLAKDLIDRFGSFAEVLSADSDDLLLVPGARRSGGRRAQNGARGGVAADEGGAEGAPCPRLMGPADRLLHGPYRLWPGRGVPPPLPRPQEHADRP